MSEEMVKWLVFVVPVLVVAAFIVPELLRCWRTHMDYKHRKAVMEANVRTMEAIAEIARAINEGKKDSE
jgi:hypothetical protein